MLIKIDILTQAVCNENVLKNVYVQESTFFESQSSIFIYIYLWYFLKQFLSVWFIMLTIKMQEELEWSWHRWIQYLSVSMSSIDV